MIGDKPSMKLLGDLLKAVDVMRELAPEDPETQAKADEIQDRILRTNEQQLTDGGREG